MNSLGDKIRLLRHQKGLSQENMADMLQISTTAFGDIERNKTELTINRAKEIANILNVSFLELLGFENTAMSHSVEITRLENEKLKAENEKLRLEASFLQDKFVKLAINEVYRLHQNERKSIGFKSNN